MEERVNWHYIRTELCLKIALLRPPFAITEKDRWHINRTGVPPSRLNY